LEEQLKTIDIYFVANFKDRWDNITGTFRVTDKVPEIWDPLSGQIDSIFSYQDINGRISCQLSLPPHGSVFVLFRNYPKKHNEISIKESSDRFFRGVPNATWRNIDSIALNHPWKIKFPPGWGAPDSIIINELKSWTEFSDPGVKYFSGTAIYETTLYVPDSLLNQQNIFYLDLGVVKEVAEIEVNDDPFPVQWKPPYSVNITNSLSGGKNSIRIKVINLWPNRIIGDQFLPAEERYTFTNIGKFTKGSPLLESGLIGPVKILRLQKVKVQF
jgi:hypothetical protein